MTARYYRSVGGAYLGAFVGSAPDGGVEVPAPPADARATWSGSAWIEPAPDRRLVPLGTLAARIVASGRLSALSAVLDAAPSARALLMGLREGIYADDQQARALLTAAGLDPDEVLR